MSNRKSLDEVIDIITDYYKEMREINSADKKELVQNWIANIQKKDDRVAKQNLISDLASMLKEKNIVLGDEHKIYPNVPPEDGLVYRIYGLCVYDAINSLSPSVESVWISANQIARYVESGVIKNYYNYMPDASEMESIQSRLEEICQKPHNKSHPILRGFIESSETRIQSYIPPRAFSRSLRTRRLVTPSFSLDDMKEMDEKSRELSKQSVKGRLNIMVGGGQNVGKTTRQIGLLLLKDPETENITIYESEHEMRFQLKWPGSVVELQDIDDMGFSAVQRDVFRNGSHTIVFAEPREGIEAHYALLSCSRGSDQTVMTYHLRVPDLDDPVSAIREFAVLVNDYRKTNVVDVYRSIASGLDIIWVLENIGGKRIDYSIFLPEMQEGHFSPRGDYIQPEPRARVLAKYDYTSKKLEWTGEMLPDLMVRFMTNKGKSDLEILRSLGLTDLKREV
ncbi:ATPase, T2SS/T4P/T4SS family [Brevibacillus sp. AG]|uniref:ATPase, T2SS/T4P/T4SS family n=1 Tax=Brevibacillus sp. AG TaxID=3020891 RepID=UPI00232AA0F4|nr:ATPase, T2SS/T4P/T4SS family [Brevibacillus sp. AG]MDC0764235.1 ATPase, T2SS/T4P/T4SS family [Brevibacillus sp. AG]